MGMYTELVLATNVQDKPEIIEILRYMIGEREEQPPLPGHPLFETERWTRMLRCCSFYFVPFALAKLEFNDISNEWGFVCRSDFKNYGNELALFIDWITPYLETDEEEMIGYSRYEETREPTIYYGRAK